jgi:DNA polymerase delta subunit 1
MFGVNEKGNSIVIHVYNFRPYFYIQVPVTMVIMESDLPALKVLLNSKLPNNYGVTGIEIVNKKSVMHF